MTTFRKALAVALILSPLLIWHTLTAVLIWLVINALGIMVVRRLRAERREAVTKMD